MIQKIKIQTKESKVIKKMIISRPNYKCQQVYNKIKWIQHKAARVITCST